MANSSKKTYTVHITYTTKSPTSDFKAQQNNTKHNSPDFGSNNESSKQASNWQNSSGKEL